MRFFKGKSRGITRHFPCILVTRRNIFSRKILTPEKMFYTRYYIFIFAGMCS